MKYYPKVFRNGELLKEVNTVIAEQIKNYIDAKGIKQKAIANATGMSKVAVSETLNGNRTLTAEELRRICDFLEVPYDRFMAPEPEPRESEVA